ncbi:sulfite exporter TauE/SafE family protein [Crocosphaera sp. UHCC 0190]|uniref:sulfite exporter TauE/SafE family protein n=1 Tax=Crocosphaera sp. UHCC 0190 TaxID=3110246 RepID=UPI002B2133B9|nr:sulfite exporter TauE/SafE family protein [Crocosphaera sp. UHCC 0190]MEA5510550.1 sulfite exporter TauE/SafE family protein [Crocosphaera sp. UHCC 0190]
MDSIRRIPGYQFIPTTLILTGWLIYMGATHQWHLFLTEWFMSVTMAFGSFIAGATAEGGGAVAFPVMTLIFHIKPAVARNFSLAIQSFGMTSAAYLIFVRRIPVEKNYLVLCSIGGVFGMVFGAFVIAPLTSPAYTKMFFVSLWLSFGCVLFFLNTNKNRVVREELPSFSPKGKMFLVGIGFLGGIISSLVGSGIDIFSFSIMTTRYRLSEKIATPTSVCLMAGNTVIGFLLHVFALKDFQPEAWNYLLVCIPVVIFGAPLGAYFITGFTRESIVKFLYFVLLAQFLGAWLIVKPYSNISLLLFTLTVFLIGLFFFFGFGKMNSVVQELGDKNSQ